MSFLDEVRQDCLEAESDLGSATMNWSGTSYPVAATLTRRGAILVIGGKEVEIRLTLRVRMSGNRSGGGSWEFTDLPKQGELVIYKDTTYRIAQVNRAHTSFLEIDLMDRNR